MNLRAVFFEEADARAVAVRLLGDGFDAEVLRDPFAGEDDDEDHAWAVRTDAPDIVVELLVEQYDGWLDVEDTGPPRIPPPDLPSRPRL